MREFDAVAPVFQAMTGLGVDAALLSSYWKGSWFR